MAITLDRPLYLNADKTKIVEEGDPAARFVLGGPGSEISDADAKLYGLEEYLKPKGKKPKEPEPPQEPEITDPKAAEPPANKMQQPGQNKEQ